MSDMEELRKERRRAQAREKKIVAALKTLDEAMKARPQLSRSYKQKLRDDVRSAKKPTIEAKQIIRDLPAPNRARADTDTTGIVDLSPSEECRTTLARKISPHLRDVGVHDEEIRAIEGKYLKGVIDERKYKAKLAKLAEKGPPAWTINYEPTDYSGWKDRPMKSVPVKQLGGRDDGPIHEQIGNIPSFLDRKRQNSSACLV